MIKIWQFVKNHMVVGVAVIVLLISVSVGVVFLLKSSTQESKEKQINKIQPTSENVSQMTSDENTLSVGECFKLNGTPYEELYKNQEYYDPSKPPNYYQYKGWTWSFEDGQWYFKPAEIPPDPPHDPKNPPTEPAVMSLDRWVWRGTYWAITD